MNRLPGELKDPRIADALAELQQRILSKYDDAAFEITQGEDPEGIYLTTVVDIDDTESIFDIICERLLELQIDNQLPIYVIAVRPVERVVEELRRQPDVGSRGLRGTASAS